jgi:predicted RND superfamily exporter protein
VAILTDGAGFAALMVSEVGPVHDFGLMMAIGSLLVLPACVLLVPGAVSLTAPGAGTPATDDSLSLGRWLGRLLAWTERNVVLLAIVTVILTTLALLGTRRLTVETDFTKNFRQESSIVRAYGFVEERFGGAGVWDLLIPMEHGLDARSLVNVVRLEEQLLEKAPNLNKAISLGDALAAWFGGPNSLARVPTFMLRTGLGAMRANDRMTQFIDTLYNVDPADKRQWIHVLLRSPEQLSAEQKTAMIHEVQSAAQAAFPEAEVTGYYVLLTKLIESVLADQWKAFIVATIVVGLMVMIALRDWRLTAVTFVPNIFPSLILFGVMGWLGVRVNMGAAMIAAVSIGLSVDSSVHYTMFYQRQRRLGHSVSYALARAQDSVGRAAVYSTLALTVGFATLCVSDFVPTIYFGVLVSLSMIGGLLGNLLVLPILIRAIEHRSRSKVLPSSASATSPTHHG